MAYDKKKIETIVSLFESEGIFDHKNKFDSEKEFINSLLPNLKSIIKSIYNEDVDTIELEKQFDLINYGYFKVRADIYIKCKSGKIFIIEAKNPIHLKYETLGAVGQMIGYQLILDIMGVDYTLILATSVFTFYLAEIIKKHNINIDLLLHNKKGTGYLLNSVL